MDNRPADACDEGRFDEPVPHASYTTGRDTIREGGSLTDATGSTAATRHLMVG